MNIPTHHKLGKRLLTLGATYNPQVKDTNTNYQSWEIIKAIIMGYGPTSYWTLAKTCHRHVHGTVEAQGKGGAPWIDYLIKIDALVEL